MSAQQGDVHNMMAHASSVDARHSVFSEVHGQQINGNHAIVNHYSKDIAQVRQELADWLTPLDFRQKQNDIYGNRQEGTGGWVFDNKIYKDWERGDAKTLWCPGIPGAGKTVIASHIVNHLASTLKSPSIAVAYIYCDYKDQSSQTVFDLEASLLKQLVQDSSPTFERVKSRYQCHREQRFRLTVKDVHDTLVSEIKTFSQVFIIVDALDEVTEERKKRYDVETNLKDEEGRTALSIAAMYERTTFVKLLLARNNVEVNSKDEDGRTPLWFAVFHGNIETVKLMWRPNRKIKGAGHHSRAQWSMEMQRSLSCCLVGMM